MNAKEIQGQAWTAQSEACLTADPGPKFESQLFHVIFMEVDLDIISPHFADSRRGYQLLAKVCAQFTDKLRRGLKVCPGKSVITLTDWLNMT